MGETGLESVVGSIFKTITLVDIGSDKVTFFDASNNYSETSSNNYEEYFNNLKKVIHPDYVNDYFNTISLNNLSSSKDYVSFNYLKLSANLNYEYYTDIIKLISDNKFVIISFLNHNDVKKNSNNSNSLSYNYTDLIINIEEIINNLKSEDYEVENAVKYIGKLLDEAKEKDSIILKNYQERVKTEVNNINKSLLIADDDSLTRTIFKKVFESEYNIIEAQNGTEAVKVIEENIVNSSSTTNNIVGIFLDLKMPVMDGFGVLDYMNDKHLISRIPVIIVSADDAKETKEQVYSYEIADMIEKPFNFEIIKKRVNNMVSMYSKSNFLKNIVINQNAEIKSILKKYIDTYLCNHEKIIVLLNKYLGLLVDKYNETSTKKVNKEALLNAAKYYDCGIGFVPNRYFSNIAELTEEERQVIYDYPKVGNLLCKYVFDDETMDFNNYLSDIILMHNERYDGRGFPGGYSYSHIPDYVYLVNMAVELAALCVSGKSVVEGVEIIKSKINIKYSLDSVNLLDQIIDLLKGDSL